MSATQLSGGKPITEDHREINQTTGQQKGYVVLTPEERAKGFVRPLRNSYVHVGVNPVWEGSVLMRFGKGGCGALTIMAADIAETYARDPSFYSGTFCIGCRAHHALEEFAWDGTADLVGS